MRTGYADLAHRSRWLEAGAWGAAVATQACASSPSHKTDNHLRPSPEQEATKADKSKESKEREKELSAAQVPQLLSPVQLLPLQA